MMWKTLLVIDLSVSKICHQNKSANMFPSFSFTFPSRRLCSTVSVCKIYLLKKKKIMKHCFPSGNLDIFVSALAGKILLNYIFCILFTFILYFIHPDIRSFTILYTVQCTLSTVLYVCISGFLSCGAAKTR